MVVIVGREGVVVSIDCAVVALKNVETVEEGVVEIGAALGVKVTVVANVEVAVVVTVVVDVVVMVLVDVEVTVEVEVV